MYELAEDVGSTDSVVLVNDDDRYALWPDERALPDGWRVVHGPAPRPACREFVDGQWRDPWPAGAGNGRRVPADEAPTGDTVAERVLRHALDDPGRPAVVHGDTTWTFGELVEHAGVLQTVLERHGVGPGTRVGLMLDRSPELVAATLAVVRCGATYVGLDVEEPPARLATMIEAAACPVVLVRRADRALPPGGRHHVITVEQELESADRVAAGEIVVPGLDDACYVTYTSGSTGAPKGVLVPHRGVVNLLAWYGETFGVLPGDRMPQLAKPSFDGWSLEVWPCLAHGGTLLVPADRIPRSGHDLAEWIRDEGVTTCFLTTVLGSELFDLDWGTEPVRLRSLLVGGEKLYRYPPPSLPFRVFHVYGPTETSMLATCGEMTTTEPTEGAPPIGRPLAGFSTAVLDPALTPVPDGEVGELYLGGTGVALGYLNGAGLTAERFVPDPGARRGARRYATGDLVRRHTDGTIEFVGRRDNQVKLRGFRIELGEVEGAARELPEVREAVAVVHRPPTGNQQLVVYVTPADEHRAITPDKIVALLAESLPAHMVPSTVTVLDGFPTTPHGKIDRVDLAGRPPHAADDDTGDVPRTPVERVLAELWCEVLGLASVGRDADFFELGGDSLTAMRVASRARKHGLRMAAEDLFEHEVLNELAAAVAPEPNPVGG